MRRILPLLATAVVLGAAAPAAHGAAVYLDDKVVAEGGPGEDFVIGVVLQIDGGIGPGAAVDLTISDGVATRGDADFTGTNGWASTDTFRVQLPQSPGPNSVDLIPASLIGDNKYERDEGFLLTLSNPSGVTIADPEGIVVIQNDDPTPTVSVVAGTTAGEGDAGDLPYEFDVTLSNPSWESLFVRLRTAPGTATVDEDYYPFLGDVTFPAGSVAQVVTLYGKGDTAVEPDETFRLELFEPVVGLSSGAIAGSVGTAFGTATIVNDDTAPGPGDGPGPGGGGSGGGSGGGGGGGGGAPEVLAPSVIAAAPERTTLAGGDTLSLALPACVAGSGQTLDLAVRARRGTGRRRARVRRMDVYLDGRRIKTVRRAPFRTRIVVARPAAGATRTVVARLRVRQANGRVRIVTLRRTVTGC